MNCFGGLEQRSRGFKRWSVLAVCAYPVTVNIGRGYGVSCEDSTAFHALATVRVALRWSELVSEWIYGHWQ